MKSSFRSRQGGMSFIGLVLGIALLVAVGALVAQAIPTAIEYQACVKAVERAKDGANPAEVRAAFDRTADIDDIKSITSRDLEITRVGERTVVKFAYNKEIPMFGPAYLLLKYSYQTK